MPPHPSHRPQTAGPDTGPCHPFPIRLSGPVIKGFGRGSKELGIPTANIPVDGLETLPESVSGALGVGVYYGVVALDPSSSSPGAGAANVHVNGNGEKKKGDKEEAKILPAVLSIGYNPFYKNETRSVEIHILEPLSPPSSSSSSSSSEQEQQREQKQNTQESKEEEQEGKGRKEVKFNKMPDFYGTRLNLLMLGYIRPEYDYVSVEALVEDIRVDCEVARRSLLRPAYWGYLADGDGDGEVKREKEWLRRF